MIWKDRIKQYPHRYTLTNVSGSTYDFAEVTGEVTEAGTPVNAENLNKLIQRDGDDIKDTVTTFTEASTRANIATGEKTSTIFGKIKKWFTDLKPHAFTTPSATLNEGTTSVPSDKLLYDTAALKANTTDLKPHAFTTPSATLNEGTTSVPSDKLLYDTAALKANTTDLKPHAFNDLAAVQGMETDNAPTNKLLTDSTFARVYRSLSEVAGITPLTVTPVELATAMAQGSILIAEIIQSEAPNLYPDFTALTAGGLFVRKADINSIYFEFNGKQPNNTYICQYVGNVRLSDTSEFQWSGWSCDTWIGATTIGISPIDLNTLITDGGKWRGTTTALAANCSNKPDTSPNGFVLECVEMRRSLEPYRTKMQTYRSNNGTWYRIGSQATSEDVVTWGDWSNIIVSTGAQTIGGAKTFTNNVTVANPTPEIFLKSTTDVYNVTAPFLATGLKCTDKNGIYTGAFRTYRSGDGSTSVYMTARNQANLFMTVGLRGYANGTWALLQGDTPGVVDIGSNTSRFKDLYLAGNINAAGTIKGNVENSPYKLVASGTLAAGASLTLNSLILNVDQAGRPFYMRIWGTTDNVYAVFKRDGYTANHITTNLFSATYSATISTTEATEQLFQGGKTSYSGVASSGNNNYCGGMIELQINRISEYTGDDEYDFTTSFFATQTQNVYRVIQQVGGMGSSYTMLNTGTSTLNYQLYSANY